MKTRIGFVSNSSSSSFICEFKPESWCDCVELSENQATNILSFLKHDNPDKTWGSGPFYITQVLSDASDYYYTLEDHPQACQYQEGTAGGSPYSDSVQLADDIFIRKEHA